MRRIRKQCEFHDRLLVFGNAIHTDDLLYLPFSQRKKQASQIFCDMLMRKTEEDQVSKELVLEIQTTIREVQESSTAAIENQGIFM